MKNKNRIGEIKPNNQGTLMKIIEDNNSTIVVEFQDKYKHKVKTTYTNFRSGEIKNPYDKTHCNVGYVGVGVYKTTLENGKHPQSYIIWNAVIERCYKVSLKDKYPAYFGICTVCKEWLNYQNFAKWYDNNFYQVGTERMHLDKDILSPGNKIYSPNTCLLVPQRINMLLFNKPNKRGLPNGISKTKYGYSVTYNSLRLGNFKTLDDAFLHYAKAKEEKIQEVAEEYRKYIPYKLYIALKEYRVLLENDKNYIAN